MNSLNYGGRTACGDFDQKTKQNKKEQKNKKKKAWATSVPARTLSFPGHFPPRHLDLIHNPYHPHL